MKKYCVYVHFKSDGIPFYVGKGSKQRAFNFNGRSEFWKRTVKKHGLLKVEIVCDELINKDACEWEQLFIKHYGRIDLKNGTLVNMTDGGDGASPGHPVSEETKQKISKFKKKENPGKFKKGNSGFGTGHYIRTQNHNKMMSDIMKKSKSKIQCQ